MSRMVTMADSKGAHLAGQQLGQLLRMLQSLPVYMVHQNHLQRCPDPLVNTLEVTSQHARLAVAWEAAAAAVNQPRLSVRDRGISSQAGLA